MQSVSAELKIKDCIKYEWPKDRKDDMSPELILYMDFRDEIHDTEGVIMKYYL